MWLRLFLGIICGVLCTTSALAKEHKITPTLDKNTNGNTLIATLKDMTEGDVLFIGAGEFNGTFRIPNGVTIYGGLSGNAATWTSASPRDPTKTIIANPQVATCLYTLNSLTQKTTIDGFTIRNGKGTVADFGRAAGGIDGYADSTKLLINNCIIHGNTSSTMGGGGVRCATVTNSYIYGNATQGNAGGGGVLECAVENCVIQGNKCTWSGGGAYKSTLKKCIVRKNSAPKYGGGLYDCTVSNTLVSENTCTEGYGGGADLSTMDYCNIAQNSAKTNGGGVSNSTLNYSCVYNNTAQNGGGIFASSATHCSLFNNTATKLGGGAYINEKGVLSYCVVTRNKGTNGSGGVHASAVGNAISNSIIWGNTSQLGGAIGTVEACAIQGGYSKGKSIVNLATENSDLNGPQFKRATSLIGASTVEADTLRVADWTPFNTAITTWGTPQPKILTVNNALSSARVFPKQPFLIYAPLIFQKSVFAYWVGRESNITPKTQSLIVRTMNEHDMEFTAIYGNTPNPGKRFLPIDAKDAVENGKILEGILAVATSGESIYLGAGDYQPTTSFNIPNGIQIFGGFSGDKMQWSHLTSPRNWRTTRFQGNGTYPCVTFPPTTQTTAIDGITLFNGVSNNLGGGVSGSNMEQPAYVRNCYILANKATNGGGGVAQVRVENSVIQNNEVTSHTASGGGAYQVRLQNCLVVNNKNKNPNGSGGTYDCDIDSSTLWNNTDSQSVADDLAHVAIMTDSPQSGIVICLDSPNFTTRGPCFITPAPFVGYLADPDSFLDLFASDWNHYTISLLDTTVLPVWLNAPSKFAITSTQGTDTESIHLRFNDLRGFHVEILRDTAPDFLHPDTIPLTNPEGAYTDTQRIPGVLYYYKLRIQKATPRP